MRVGGQVEEKMVEAEAGRAEWGRDFSNENCSFGHRPLSGYSGRPERVMAWVRLGWGTQGIPSPLSLTHRMSCPSANPSSYSFKSAQTPTLISTQCHGLV